jgi:hypothetical protein
MEYLDKIEKSKENPMGYLDKIEKSKENPMGYLDKIERFLNKIEKSKRISWDIWIKLKDLRESLGILK